MKFQLVKIQKIELGIFEEKFQKIFKTPITHSKLINFVYSNEIYLILFNQIILKTCSHFADS